MPTEETEKNAKKMPIWACIAIVLLVTFLTFWFFGGQNYIHNSQDIDYTFWRHEEEWKNWMRWIFYFFKIGVVPGFLGFVSSTAILIAINRKRQNRNLGSRLS